MLSGRPVRLPIPTLMLLAVSVPAARAQVTTTPLRDGIFVVSGAGGNILVVPAPQGTLLVDAGVANSAGPGAALLRERGVPPVRLVLPPTGIRTTRMACASTAVKRRSSPRRRSARVGRTKVGCPAG